MLKINEIINVEIILKFKWQKSHFRTYIYPSSAMQYIPVRTHSQVTGFLKSSFQIQVKFYHDVPLHRGGVKWI